MKDRTVMGVSLPGPFAGKAFGEGRWRLTRDVATVASTTAATPVEVFIQGANRAAAEVFADPGIARLDLEWRSSGVIVTVSGRRGTRCVDADSVIVHEPRNELYQALPLAGFDGQARRFWSRVFALMRIPGGRLLLRIIARRRR